MINCLVIQNDAVENLGLYEKYLREYSNVDVIHPYSMTLGDNYPSVDEYDLFLVGPTPIPANDVNQHRFLVREWDYLSKIIASEKPTLGVCCGGQILARLLGANVVKSPQKEVGVYTLKLTDNGMHDPLFQGFSKEFPVFHWHSDMFMVPTGGKLLVTGHPCPIQSYVWRNVRGVIFHLEIDHIEAERWASAYPSELEAVSKTKKQVVEECKTAESEMKYLAGTLIDNFVSLVK